MNYELYDMVSGIIKDIYTNNDKKSLLIEDEEGIEYVFHINDFTVVTSFGCLDIGQEVDIIFNGILTRSLPPQGNAIIVNGLTL